MANTPRNTADAAQDKATQTSAPARKRERIPFGVPRSKLSVPVIPTGYHLHWVSDEGGRVLQAQDGGYEFVAHEEVGMHADHNGEVHVKRLVGKQENGEALFAYLMKIRQEWFEEDQQSLQSQIDRVENAIRSGTFEENAGDQRYVPKTGISIK